MAIRQRLRRDDAGATLLIVLIIITSVSLVMGAIISQSETAVRSTVQLRDQASDNYSADAATQAVLAGLKTSGITCADPASPASATLGSTASPFYSPVASQQGPINAYAQCAPDAITGKVLTTSTPAPSTSVTTVTPAPVTSTGATLGSSDPTLPSYALMAVGTGANDYGVDISTSANNKVTCVENGSVYSNKNINASGETLAVRLSGTGTASDCTTGTGVSSANGSRLVVNAAGSCLGGTGAFTPTACTSSAPSVTTPTGPALPSSIAKDNPAPVCLTSGSTTYAAFVPGRYTSADNLNSPCTKPAKTLYEWLSPGTYVFDFTSTTTQWSWPDILVAGTPTTSSGTAISGLDPTNASTLSNLSGTGAAPNACIDPAVSTTGSGVRLIFGGASTVLASSSGSAEVCASGSSTTAPVAIQGIVADQSATGPSGAITLHGETLCTSSGCGSNSLINTDVNGQAALYINGYVYAPNAQLVLTLKNSNGQVFNWGIIVRDFRLTVNGSSPTQAFVKLPRPNTTPGPKVTTSTPAPYPSTSVTQPPPSVSTKYTIRYISVWTCTVASLTAAGRTTCPATGQPNLQARVLTDTNGVPQRILSWAHIR